MTGSDGSPDAGLAGAPGVPNADDSTSAPVRPNNHLPRRGWVALDRDGTMIQERNYLSDPGQVELSPGAAEGLRAMQKMDLGLVVVTNQSGIGRGYFDLARLELIHQKLIDLLESENVYLDGIYHCPHLPEDNCHCRKPRTGLLEKAEKDLSLVPSSCFVIGDKASDIEMGQRAGATTLLVRTGYGAEGQREGKVNPDYSVEGLTEAAQIIQRLVVVQGIMK